MITPWEHAQEIVSWYRKHYTNPAEMCERLRRHADMLSANDPEVSAAIFRSKVDGVKVLGQ